MPGGKILLAYLLVGAALVVVASLVALTVGMVRVVAGGFIGWTRSTSHSTKWEADDHERVDAIVEEAREDAGARSGR
jgi:hypothetical protein